MTEPPDPSDHAALVESATCGDREAIGVLLERHLPRLAAYVRAKAGAHILRRESSGDLVQSVCREVLEDLGALEYRGEAQFRYLLCQMALRKIVDRSRFVAAERRDPEREVPLEDESDEGEALATLLTPSRDAIGRERARRVDAALAELPDDQREAILLYRVVGLAYPEIAEAMARSEGAVRNLVYRGVARLSSRIQERDDADDPAGGG